MRYAVLSIACVLAIAGCTNQSGAHMGLLNTTSPVLAVVAGEVYTGQSVCHWDGTGAIQLKSLADSHRECSGDFHYESQDLGVGDIHCSAGPAATFQFRALGTLTGYGFGRAREGEVTFAYGMTPEQADPYLRLPPGTKLQRKDDKISLTGR